MCFLILCIHVTFIWKEKKKKLWNPIIYGMMCEKYSQRWAARHEQNWEKLFWVKAALRLVIIIIITSVILPVILPVINILRNSPPPFPDRSTQQNLPPSPLPKKKLK